MASVLGEAETSSIVVSSALRSNDIRPIALTLKTRRMPPSQPQNIKLHAAPKQTQSYLVPYHEAWKWVFLKERVGEWLQHRKASELLRDGRLPVNQPFFDSFTLNSRSSATKEKRSARAGLDGVLNALWPTRRSKRQATFFSS